ncbi:hypothetical protein NITHO_4890003 [Nitrolancea hollandica Lb]|uniref:Uncharacterized protein n=1 Tax=Nitrolancea hollandica Lb TaxID=1129897 RepID=I4EL12_9BACT|nr:hypothetical protein NITHO_4890003 [Nitrolancea hollandica Lb]
MNGAASREASSFGYVSSISAIISRSTYLHPEFLSGNALIAIPFSPEKATTQATGTLFVIVTAPLFNRPRHVHDIGTAVPAAVPGEAPTHQTQLDDRAITQRAAHSAPPQERKRRLCGSGK